MKKFSLSTSPQSIGICFSCGVRKQNGKDVMAWDTKARVDKALMLFRLGLIDTILCTGGIFQDGQTRPISAIMSEYLAENGVPKSSLLIEEKSVDTGENIKLGLALLKRKGVLNGLKTTEDLRLVLISEPHHLRRIEITMHAHLKKMDLDHLIPLLFEPVHYSISDYTLHTEEALFHKTILDPFCEGEEFQQERAKRKVTKK